MGYQVLLAEDEARMRDIVRDYLAETAPSAWTCCGTMITTRCCWMC